MVTPSGCRTRCPRALAMARPGSRKYFFPSSASSVRIEAGKEVFGARTPADAMRAWPISPRVNIPRNSDPDLILPLAS